MLRQRSLRPRLVAKIDSNNATSLATSSRTEFFRYLALQTKLLQFILEPSPRNGACLILKV
jgi:hypothetical protein